MSAQANIIAFDGAATPVSHTLNPIGVEKVADENRSYWRENLVTLPVEAQVRVTQTSRKLKSGITRVATIVEVPVMESIAGANSSGYTAAPKVAFTDAIHVVGYFNSRSTITSRRLARQLALNIAGAISTSVTPATAGFVPDQIDMLINAS